MKRRILLADDSVTIQKVIELTFMDEDFEVRAVSNGDEALALLPEVRPDFVIADVHMPGANGYQVCRRAKQQQPGVPVLLLVGTFEPFDEGEAKAAGADSFLKKPFDSQELLQRVQELVAPAPSMAAPAAPAFTPPAFTPAAAPPPDLAFPSLEATGVGAFGAPAPAPAFAPEPPVWGFDLDPAPAATPSIPIPPPIPSFAAAPEPPSPTPPPIPSFAAPPSFEPEPFDREPSFSLEPDPAYQVQAEPVFELEAESSSYGVQDQVFGAPDELSFDEPAPAAPAAASAPAGFDWAATPAEPFPASGFGGGAPDLRLDESLPAWQTAPEPEPASPWAAAAPEPQAWAEPEPMPSWQTEPEPQAWAPEPEPQPAWSAPEPTPEPSYGAPDTPYAAPAAAVAAPAATAAADAAPTNGGGHLSDQDVDRIARRIVELLGDKAVRDVAWEVIPDLAEVIIRDRLRELEAQVE